MRNFFNLAALIAAVALSQSAVAVERIEEPLTFRHAMNWKSHSVLSFGRLDVDKIVAEDDLNVIKGQPLRVAIARMEKSGVEYEHQGEWSVIDDVSVWRLKVNASNAEWLSFAFDDVFLPFGAALYVYSENHEQVLGPYTDKDNKPSKKLWTPMVYGEVAYVEINVPTRMKSYLTFNLKNVNHGYRNMKSISTPKVGACNIDVVCPQGNNWRDEIRSVARYVYDTNGDLFTCTGNLVNNAVGDRKAYFLTANHCVATQAEAQSMVLYWNFEKSVCGGSADGSQAQSQIGATLLATVGSLDGPEPKRDMTLLQLDTVPRESYNVHWSGWETSPIPPSSGVGIHHPDGTEKRISVDSGPIVITDFGSATENPNGTHLKIGSWDEGTTEGGSSGSGFWNSENRLVGVLSGGGASCDTPNEPDFYAHLASHYAVGSTSSTRLKAWLDPSNTNVSQVDGIDSCDAPNVSFSINPNPAEANENVTFTSVVTGAAGAGTTYAWDFDGNGSVDSTLASPVYAYSNVYVGNVNLTVINAQNCTGSASAGIVVTPMGGNTPPNAIAAAAQTVGNEGTTVQLDATGSTDDDGDNLTYAWSQTAGPTAVLVNASSATPSVTLPEVSATTVVTFQVTVSDSFNASDTDSVNITTLNVNRAPAALVSNATLSINEGGTVTLNAGASSDPDGDSLSFSWAQTSGAAVTLRNATTATASFTAPQVSVATTLVFAVTVTDGPGLTDTATVTVTVNNVPPPVTTSGGGGGALGLPLLALLALAGYARRARPVSSGLLAIAGCSFLFACSTAETGSTTAEKDSSPSTISTKAAEEGSQIILFKRGLEKSVARITNSGQINQLVSAFENRERRYEKIKPLFEYEMSIKVDGTSETWMVSPSGYIQKEQSYELYKMDVSQLKSFMK